MSEQVLEYVRSNFELLPFEIIESILLRVPPSDLLNFCTSNQEFNQLCMDTRILDTAALRYLVENAPIAEPITSFTQQANRVQAGLSTQYRFYFTLDEDNRWEIPNGVEFLGEPDRSGPYEERLRNGCVFSIKGFPAKSGTVVYVAYNDPVDDLGLPIGQAYLTPEEGFRSLLEQDILYYINVWPEPDIFARLLNREHLNGYAIFRVELP